MRRTRDELSYVHMYMTTCDAPASVAYKMVHMKVCACMCSGALYCMCMANTNTHAALWQNPFVLGNDGDVLLLSGFDNGPNNDSMAHVLQVVGEVLNVGSQGITRIVWANSVVAIHYNVAALNGCSADPTETYGEILDIAATHCLTVA